MKNTFHEWKGRRLFCPLELRGLNAKIPWAIARLKIVRFDAGLLDWMRAKPRALSGVRRDGLFIPIHSRGDVIIDLTIKFAQNPLHSLVTSTLYEYRSFLLFVFRFDF